MAAVGDRHHGCMHNLSVTMAIEVIIRAPKWAVGGVKLNLTKYTADKYLLFALVRTGLRMFQRCTRSESGHYHYFT